MGFTRSARSRLLVAAMLLTALCAGPTAQAKPLAGAMSARVAKLIAAPGPDAEVRAGSVRLVVRRPAGATMVVLIGRRDVTTRFRPAGGGTLAARLTPGDGV